jgi:hypothetical protein
MCPPAKEQGVDVTLFRGFYMGKNRGATPITFHADALPKF